ncbi:MAG TPA: hypothetical protein VMX36_12525, partial [Sedimentisphaerales bacterium]|nr:hypothetical protein [Sedimentisphaerales bacterium]
MENAFWTGFTGFTQKKRYRQDNRINKRVPNNLSSASCYPVKKFLFSPFFKYSFSVSYAAEQRMPTHGDIFEIFLILTF